MLYIEYAEQFGILPQDVTKTVTVAEWERWKAWRKAQASHSLWEVWQRDAKSATKFDKTDMETWLWAMLKDKR